jgi:hypothetical protein
MSEPTNAQISARAHAIFLRRGSQPGRALDDWLQAERELRDEAARAAKFSSPSVYGTPPGARPAAPTSSFAPPPSTVSPHSPLPPRPPAPPTASFAPPVPPAKAPPSPTKPSSTPAKPPASKSNRPNDDRPKKKR